MIKDVYSFWSIALIFFMKHSMVQKKPHQFDHVIVRYPVQWIIQALLVRSIKLFDTSAEDVRY